MNPAVGNALRMPIGTFTSGSGGRADDQRVQPEFGGSGDERDDQWIEFFLAHRQV